MIYQELEYLFFSFSFRIKLSLFSFQTFLFLKKRIKHKSWRTKLCTCLLKN